MGMAEAIANQCVACGKSARHAWTDEVGRRANGRKVLICRKRSCRKRWEAMRPEFEAREAAKRARVVGGS